MKIEGYAGGSIATGSASFARQASIKEQTEGRPTTIHLLLNMFTRSCSFWMSPPSFMHKLRSSVVEKAASLGKVNPQNKAFGPSQEVKTNIQILLA